MEGCPRMPMIGFDSKVCVESVNLCEKIPQFITSNYHENGDNYLNECEQINRLRQSALNATGNENGVTLIKRYYCQLLLLRNRFPMLPDNECSVRFTWEDAFQKEETTFNDVRFEEASILYNIAAIYSRLGSNETRKNAESIKEACSHFRSAAGCFEKVRDQYTTYTADFTPDLLSCQIQILLGQAHETVLEKSLLDQRTATVNSRIAAQIVEYFQTALLNLNKPGTNSIVSKRFKELRVILTFKLSFYLALTFYYSGLVAEENKKYGQMVCYFEAATERLKEAWKNSEKISSEKVSIFKEVHNFTNDLVTTKFRMAKRDNDAVYFDRVPTLSSLIAVQGVVVAKGQMFDCHSSEISGVDIFNKLVPMDAHLSSSEYSAAKDRILREVVDLIENKDRELESFLRCVQLDRFPLNNDYLKLPRDLVDCCAAAAAQPTLTKELVVVMQQLNDKHHELVEQLDDIQQALTTIDRTSQEIEDLKTNVDAIRQMLEKANENNLELHRHMTNLIETLKNLSLPLDQFEKTLPIIVELEDEKNKPTLSRLVLLTEKIQTMKNQREMLINDLRQNMHNDDITKLLLMHRHDNHQNLYEEQIKKHQQIVDYIKQNCLAQDNILQAFTETNAEAAEIRVKIVKTFENRTRLINEYINTFKSFPDTTAKANEGIEFYKRQMTKMIKIKEQIDAFKSKQIPVKPVTPRPDIKENDFIPTELDSQVSDRPRLKDFLAAMKPDSWGGSSSTKSRAAKRAATRSEESMYLPPIPITTRTPRSSMQNTLPRAQFSSFDAEQIPHEYISSMPPTTPQKPFMQLINQPTSFAQQIPYQPMPSVQNQGVYQQNYPPTISSQTSYPTAPSQLTSTTFMHASHYPNMPTPTPIPPMQQQFPLHSMPYHSLPQTQVQPGYQYPYPMNQQQHVSTIAPVPTKFDPYRPQPIGAYDIPKGVQSSLTPQNPSQTHSSPQSQPMYNLPAAFSQQSSNQYPVNQPAPINNAQDIYRPSGMFLPKSPLLQPTIVSNNNNNNHNIVSTPVKPKIPEKTSNTITLVDDLLSLALEAQTETIPSLNPPEEDLQQKNSIKPIACIQPLPIVIEEKKIVPATPSATLTNINPTRDPYEDREKLEQLVADVQRFEKHVTTMTQKTLNGTVPLEVEWKELSDFQERETHSQTSAIGKCNHKLNRFQDLIPYDNSRVCLTQNNVSQPLKNFNDYINASNIGRIREVELITSQYPLSTTIADFWSMIYDQHVNIIVVLLRPEEILSNVCPTKVGDELKYSFVSITLLSNKASNSLTNHKILRVQHLHTNQSRTIVWLEHLDWPPKEMSENPNEFLKFIGDVEHFLNQSRNRKSTILATCLSGVSRVGPFLTLFTAIQDINEGRNFPDLNKIIRSLRIKRRHIIQDMNQLKFVYEALLEYTQNFLIKRGAMQPKINSPRSSTTNNVHQLNDVLQTMIEQAKPSIVSTPNYDVGPILSTPNLTTTIKTEEKSSIKQLSPIEENFNLRPEESHIRPRTTRDDFFRPKSASNKDCSDPFNELDPLWMMRS